MVQSLASVSALHFIPVGPLLDVLMQHRMETGGCGGGPKPGWPLREVTGATDLLGTTSGFLASLMLWYLSGVLSEGAIKS